MTRKFIVLLTVPAFVLIMLFVWFAFYYGTDDEIQPLAFNHKIHIEGAGLQCADCHLYVDKLPSASIPRLEICQNCHSGDPISESLEEKKLLTHISEGTEIPWKRIYKLPDHVYFSHRRHVVGGEMECSVCHGNVAEMTSPILNAAIPLTKENCMRCHKERNVTNDCLTCHR